MSKRDDLEDLIEELHSIIDRFAALDRARAAREGGVVASFLDDARLALEELKRRDYTDLVDADLRQKESKR